MLTYVNLTFFIFTRGVGPLAGTAPALRAIGLLRP